MLAFYYSVEMSLVLLGLSPLVVFGAWYLSKATTDAATNMSNAYAKAGGIASGTLGKALRTVAALGTEKQHAARYNASLVQAQKAGIRKSYRIGFANGLLFASG